jgi:plastocyanin
MSNTGWAVVIIVLIVILGGGWWWYSTQQSAAPATTTTQTTDTTGAQGTTGVNVDTGAAVSAGAGANAANTTTIHLTASGFSPASVTIAKGQTVMWVDDTAAPMWIASNAHPIHSGYDGTDRTTHCAGNYTGPTPFDECQGGTGNYTFVFSKAGTFGFHDHLSAQFEGTVTVK